MCVGEPRLFTPPLDCATMASMVDCSALEASGLAEKLNKDDSLWCVPVAAR